MRLFSSSSTLALSGCFRVFGCSIQHSSVCDAELVARSCFQLLSKAIHQSVLLPFCTYCGFHHCLNISLWSRWLLKKALTAPALLYICPLSSSNLCRASAPRTSCRKWLKLWNLSLILSALPLSINVKQHVCMVTKKKEGWLDWLMTWS